MSSQQHSHRARQHGVNRDRETVRAVVEMRESGETIKAIAFNLGITLRQVDFILKQSGVTVIGKTRRAVKRLAKAGLTVCEIARRLEVKQSTVSFHLKNLGMTGGTVGKLLPSRKTIERVRTISHLPVKQISKTLGISYQRAWRALRNIKRMAEATNKREDAR